MNIRSSLRFLVLLLPGVSLHGQNLADTVDKYLPGTWGQTYIKNGVAQVSEAWGYYYFLRFGKDHSGVASEEDQCSGLKTKNGFSWNYDEKNNALSYTTSYETRKYFVRQLDSITLYMHRLDLPDNAEDLWGIVFRKLRIP
jgi:hypothetical protein